MVTFWQDGEPLECAKGLQVSPQRSAVDAGALDVLVHPGGFGNRAQLENPAHLEWVRQQRAAVPLMTSVCTGSLIFAKSGLLANRPATSWWGALDRLKEIDPTVDVRSGVRYVDDGDVVTSAGVLAGMDMALNLVARFSSPDRAREVARGIEYDYGDYGRYWSHDKLTHEGRTHSPALTLT